MLDGLSLPLPEVPRNTKYVMIDGNKVYFILEDDSVVWDYLRKDYYLKGGGLRRIGKSIPYWYHNWYHM